MKNNIFDYATKELSQDAILCYIFKNFYSDNVKEREISKKFIKEFVFNGKNVDIKDINNLKYEGQNKVKQIKKYGNIDICLEIELKNNEKYLILIEDKTETFLYPRKVIEYDLDGNKIKNRNNKECDSQLEKEIENALNDESKKDYNIVYILFKTKENYEMQYFYNFDIYEEKYKNEKRVDIKSRNGEQFLDALDENTEDIILKMIREYYKKIIRKTDKKTEKSNKSNLLDRIDKENVKKLDKRLREITKIENENAIYFFRPGGTYKQEYRTEIHIRNEILKSLKNDIKNNGYRDLIERSHWVLDIEWTDKIEVDIKLNICDERDSNYLTFKELIIRDEKRYRAKSDNRKRLIEFMNKKLTTLDENYIKGKIKDNSLQVMKYVKECTESLKNEKLVDEIVKIVEMVYKDCIKVLNEFIISD